MFKTVKDFGGYWVKGIVNFKGDHQEPLFQCSVYKDNKRIGFFSQDHNCGEDNLDCPKEADQEALKAYAKKHEGEEAWIESYSTFIAAIATEIDLIKHYKKLCKTKLVYRPASYDRHSYKTIPLNKLKGLSWEKARIALEKKTGEEITIINEELEKL